jgi:hypothetical protein
MKMEAIILNDMHQVDEHRYVTGTFLLWTVSNTHFSETSFIWCFKATKCLRASEYYYRTTDCSNKWNCFNDIACSLQQLQIKGLHNYPIILSIFLLLIVTKLSVES